jgi:hypothetical protein
MFVCLGLCSLGAGTLIISSLVYGIVWGGVGGGSEGGACFMGEGVLLRGPWPMAIPTLNSIRTARPPRFAQRQTSVVEQLSLTATSCA